MKEKKVVPLDLWEKVTYALNRFIDEEENWEHEKGDRWDEGIAAVDAIEQFEIEQLDKKDQPDTSTEVVLPFDLMEQTVFFLSNYIEADELAEGYGGGTDNPYFKPAKRLLKKLKKIEKAALKKIAEQKGKPL